MAQFDIYKSHSEGVDFFLDLQDDLLESLVTRIVAPLVSPEVAGPTMKRVNPRINVGGREHVLMAHLLAAIPVKVLSDPIGSAADQRNEIIAALDLIFTGI